MPMRRGRVGNGCFLPASNRPSASSLRFSSSKRRRSAPSPASSRCSMTTWNSPRASYRLTRPRASTRAPSLTGNRTSRLRLRNMAQRTWAASSLSEKYQWPEAGRARFEISPSSQTEPSPRSSSDARRGVQLRDRQDLADGRACRQRRGFVGQRICHGGIVPGGRAGVGPGRPFAAATTASSVDAGGPDRGRGRRKPVPGGSGRRVPAAHGPGPRSGPRPPRCRGGGGPSSADGTHAAPPPRGSLGYARRPERVQCRASFRSGSPNAANSRRSPDLRRRPARAGVLRRSCPQEVSLGHAADARHPA